MSLTTLPVLNLAHYHSAAERDAFLEQLRHAARDVGFFYLTHHGVDETLSQQLQHQARRFFALPDAQKQQDPTRKNSRWRWCTPRIFAVTTAAQPN